MILNIQSQTSMTRYPAGHKDKTREHLLQTARTVFRERGFDAASIDTLMKAAGLTRGGFYAHFKSKEALVAEVLAVPSGLTERLGTEVTHDDEGRQSAADIFADYLDPAQRDDRIYCPMVAHPMDARRGGPDRAALYGDQIASLIDAVSQVVDDDETATLTAVLAVGAAIVSASVADDALARRVESTALKEIQRRLLDDEA